MASGTALYNVPLVLDIHGSLDVAALSRALDEIVRRHEPLRTVYTSEDGLPHQVILAPSSFQLALEALECESGESDEAAIDRAATLEVRRPFDLRTGPVFRARLLRRSATAHVLVVTIHHIAIDGWSLGSSHASSRRSTPRSPQAPRRRWRRCRSGTRISLSASASG